MSKRNADPVEHQSTNPLADRLEQLKQLFPEAVNEDGIDIDSLVNLLGKEEQRKERYSFTWAGKQEAILSLQKRSKATLKPVPQESINWDSTRHLFIEGDNMEAMKLLYKSYFGRVKMIYIDPPYNTGNDFVYPDDYSDPINTYLQMTGQLDEDGNILSSNTEVNGKRHSRWLSMMYPRLFLARQLLRDDGVIFISIDDNEVHNLRMLMNEIFGEENFLANVVWQKKYGPANDAKQLSQTHEHILVYAKQSELWSPELLPRSQKQLEAYKNPDNDPRGVWRASDLSARTYSDTTDYPITIPSGEVVYPPESRSWIVSEDTFHNLVADNRIWFGVNGDARPMQKKFLSEVKQGITPQTWWDREFAGDNKIARYRIKELFPENPFDTPKPVELMERILQISTKTGEHDIVMDFFAGSATMAEAVFKLNRQDKSYRKFIMIQLPELMKHDKFDNIFDLATERVRRVIQELQTQKDEKLNGFEEHPDEDLGFRVFRLDKSPVRQWEELPADSTTAEEYAEQMALFISDPLLEGWTVEDVIAEIAVKESGFSLSYRIEPIDTITQQNVYRVVDDEKEQAFYICLDDSISLEALKPLKLTQDELFIFRDSAINDTIIANLAIHSRIKSI